MRPPRVLVALWTTLVLVLSAELGGAPPLASSRPYTPLTVTIAGAEVIAAVRVQASAGPGSALTNPAGVDVSALRAFKGTVGEGRLTVRLAPFEFDVLHQLGPGRECILFLAPAGKPGEYRLTDDTILPYDEAHARRLAGMIPLVPAWSAASDGLETVAVPDHDPHVASPRDPFRYRVGEPVLLWAGYRNVSSREVVLRYRDWRRDSRTRWELHVERVGAGAVMPLAHPHVNEAQIRDFFSRNGHHFDYALKPGEVFFLYLDRINLAEAGWGFKERLDFRYYPMAVAGEYTITATSRFLHAGAPLRSRALRLWID